MPNEGREVVLSLNVSYSSSRCVLSSVSIGAWGTQGRSTLPATRTFESPTARDRQSGLITSIEQSEQPSTSADVPEIIPMPRHADVDLRIQPSDAEILNCTAA